MALITILVYPKIRAQGKSIKNAVEIEWMTKFELLDSVAVSKTLMTVEKNVTNGGTLHELDVREILKAARREVSPNEYKGFNIYAVGMDLRV